MATRFYFAATTGPTGAITPGFAAWTRTSEAIRRWMGPTKDGSTLAGTTFWAGAAAAANASCLSVQFVSDKLAAGIAFTTSDTIKCVLQGRESATNDNINRSPICVKVYSADGTTLQATLKGLGHIGPNTTEWLDTGLRSKRFADGDALSAGYTTVEGDRLVVEVGGQVSASAGTSVTGTLNIGSSNGTDLPENETQTTAGDPWFEISRDLVFSGHMTADPASYAWTPAAAALTYVAQFHLALSSHIAAAAATSTTYRLTPPSGKTSAAFDAGRISDDTNPLPTLDVGSGHYTELEWCVAAAAGLTDADEYEFRVLQGAAVLDSYTQTPTWTIGTGVNNYTLAADAASWAWSGTAAGLLRTALVAAGVAAFAWTPADAGLAKNYAVVADAAAYTWTPTDAHLWATPASWALTTNPAGAVAGVPFTTQPVLETRTSLGLPAHAAGLTVTAQLSAGLGTLGGTPDAVTGDDGVATFTDLSLDTAQTGAQLHFFGAALGDVYDSLDVTGSGSLSASPAAYAWTGSDATLTYVPTGDYTLAGDGAAFAWTPSDAGAVAGFRAAAAAGAYDWTPADVTYALTRALVVEAAAWAWTPAAATLRWAREFSLVASSFIPAGGATATTARLTAPAGKTSGADFEAGAISDDTNPLATLDLGSGKYTELEWAVVARTDLVDTDQYEFRVLAGSTVLDSYTETPTWIIGTGLDITMGAASADYLWTGTDAGLRATYRLAADPASYALTVADAGLTALRTLAAGAAAYVWTGADATFGYTQPSTYNLTADPAAYLWTVAAATLEPQSPPGAYLLTLEDATLAAGYRLDAVALAWAWALTDAAVRRTALLSADAAAYAFDVADAFLTYGQPGQYTLTAETADYAWTAADGGLRAALRLLADPGAYLWTGTAATTAHNWTAVAEAVGYLWTPAAAGLHAARPLAAEGASYLWTPTDATLTHGQTGAHLLVATPAAYAWTPAAATLQRTRLLLAAPAAYLWTVQAAGLATNVPIIALPPEPLYVDFDPPAAQAPYFPTPIYVRLGDSAMLAIMYLEAGELLPVFRATLRLADHTPVDLTGADIVLHLRRYRGLAEGGALPAERTFICSIAGAPTDGVVEYAWLAGETDTPGNYRGYLDVTWPAGERRVPTVGFLSVFIRP